MALTRSSLNKLRKRLPRGYQQRVADLLGNRYSRAYVGMVANGDRQNEEIVLALINDAERHARTAATLAQRINAL